MKKIILSLAFVCFVTSPAFAQKGKWKGQDAETHITEGYQNKIDRINANEKMRPEVKELLNKQATMMKESRLKHAQEMQSMHEKFKLERQQLNAKLNITGDDAEEMLMPDGKHKGKKGEGKMPRDGKQKGHGNKKHMQQ